MHCSLLIGDISVAIFLWGEFFFAICFRQITFFCAKNIFSSHLVTMAIGSANPVILYQLTEFQAPSSNTFREILLTIFECANLQRAITPEIFDRICSKVDRVIYSSSPIN